MEEIYPPANYGASNKITLADYFGKFGNVFESDVFSASRTENIIPESEYLLQIKTLMDVDVSFDTLKNLSNTCSIDQLTCDIEDTKNFPLAEPAYINSTSNLLFPFITTHISNLNVNKSLQLVQARSNSSQMCAHSRRQYHKKIEFPELTDPTNLLPGTEFVVSILIYKPVAFKFFSAKNTSERLRFDHEILALGRNTLSEVRNAILCASDSGLCKEVENISADLKELGNAKAIYPSGFLFIDNVFYNDFSDKNAIDYSAPIIAWAKDKNIILHSQDMENVTIDTLSPRLGYPYLYMHQGDCEHLFVFADAKLLDNSDCLHAQSYPHILRLNRHANKMCLMCSVSSAKWICVDSDRLPQNKVFLCTECCNAYNYVDWKKIGDFKLYPYYEQHGL